MTWERVKIGDLFHVGSSKRVLKSQWQTQGVPFYRGREITKLSLQGYVDNELFISESLYHELEKKYGVPKSGDIMITAIGTIGNSYIVSEGDRFYFKDASVLWLKRNSDADSVFVNCWLKSDLMKKQLEAGNGATVDTLTITKLKDLEIVLPDIREQKRIVALLDEAFVGIDTAIANTQRNLANARELFESYLNSCFKVRDETWVQKNLKEVCLEFGRGKSKHRPRNDPALYGGNYPFIQTGDVRNSKQKITNYTKTYNDKGVAQSMLWPKGTICITIAANIAETGILDFDACFPDSIIGMVVDESQSSNAYVEYLLQSVKARIKAKGKGSAQDNINLATFENECFPFPSLNVQSEIVEKLNDLSLSLDRLEKIYESKLESLLELKQSLLQKAFSGELTKDEGLQRTWDEAVA